MPFSVKNLKSFQSDMMAFSRRIKALNKNARQGRGILPPLASTRKVANEAVQKGKAGIARVAREGDQAAMIELRGRRGRFR